MKKIKVLFLILFMCFLTGCTANYNLVISDNLISEETKISMNNSEYDNFLSDNNNKYVNMYVDDENNLGSDGVILPIEGVKYYNFENDSSNNTIYYRGTFSYDNYQRTSIKTLGFKKVILTNNDNELILSTSTGFTFLYDNLDKVYVNITSDYDVISSNADSVNGNTLTWNITKNNAKNKNILVKYNISENNSTQDKEEIKNNETQEEETTSKTTLSNVKIIIITISILVILLIVFIILKNKFNKNNKI